MFDTISVTDLRRQFSAVLDAVAQNGAVYVVTRRKKAVVVLIPYSMYVQLRKQDSTAIDSEFDNLLGKMAELHADISDDDVESDLLQAGQERNGKLG